MYVLNPVPPVKPLAGELPVVAPLATLDGKVLGFLDNCKPNNDLLQGFLEEMLREQFALAGVICRVKPSAMQGAPPDYFDALGKADAVVNGLGD